MNGDGFDAKFLANPSTITEGCPTPDAFDFDVQRVRQARLNHWA
jgi:hypothetical protein